MKLPTQLALALFVLAAASLHGTGVPIRETVDPQKKAICEGRGARRTVNSPDWPVTFSYPASWKEEPMAPALGGGIAVICQDPESLKYDSKELVITTGRIADIEKEWGFVLSGSIWSHNARGACAQEPSTRGCSVEVATVNGLTVLEADEQELRIYDRNGYVGQGEGLDVVVLVDNFYVRLIGQAEPSNQITQIVASMKRH